MMDGGKLAFTSGSVTRLKTLVTLFSKIARISKNGTPAEKELT
jgi:hypothetical protein